MASHTPWCPVRRLAEAETSRTERRTHTCGDSACQKPLRLGLVGTIHGPTSQLMSPQALFFRSALVLRSLLAGHAKHIGSPVLTQDLADEQGILLLGVHAGGFVELLLDINPKEVRMPPQAGVEPDCRWGPSGWPPTTPKRCFA